MGSVFSTSQPHPLYLVSRRRLHPIRDLFDSIAVEIHMQANQMPRCMKRFRRALEEYSGPEMEIPYLLLNFSDYASDGHTVSIPNIVVDPDARLKDYQDELLRVARLLKCWEVRVLGYQGSLGRLEEEEAFGFFRSVASHGFSFLDLHRVRLPAGAARGICEGIRDRGSSDVVLKIAVESLQNLMKSRSDDLAIGLIIRDSWSRQQQLECFFNFVSSCSLECLEFHGTFAGNDPIALEHYFVGEFVHAIQTNRSLKRVLVTLTSKNVASAIISATTNHPTIKQLSLAFLPIGHFASFLAELCATSLEFVLLYVRRNQEDVPKLSEALMGVVPLMRTNTSMQELQCCMPVLPPVALPPELVEILQRNRYLAKLNAATGLSPSLLGSIMCQLSKEPHLETKLSPMMLLLQKFYIAQSPRDAVPDHEAAPCDDHGENVRTTQTVAA